MSFNGSYGEARTAAGFLNLASIAMEQNFEMRRKSVFGPLSQPIKGKTAASNSTDRGIDISKTEAVQTKMLGPNDGDEINWTLVRKLTGPVTMGDRVPSKGGYMDFWHNKMRINMSKCPAFQIPGKLDLNRLEPHLFEQYKPLLTSQINLWWAQWFAHQMYMAFFRGADDTLLAPVNNGGLNVDLGAGAGKQVSPLNVLVRGQGMIGGATLAARETNIKSAIGSLSTSTAGHKLTLAALSELSEELSTSGRYMGVDVGGEEKFYLVLPSIARNALQGVSSTLVDFAKYQAAWGNDHPLLKMVSLSVGKLLVIYDDSLARYCPDVTSSDIVWGKAQTGLDNEFQNWEYADLTAAQKKNGIGMVLGASSLREASRDRMEYTEETGPHGVGHEISARKQGSVIRSQWRDMQDSTKLPFDQSSLLFCFAMEGLTHGA